jgi:hypothetical protein
MKRLLGGLLVTIAAVALLAFLFGGWLLRGSLPQLDGEVAAAEGGPDAVLLAHLAVAQDPESTYTLACVSSGWGLGRLEPRVVQIAGAALTRLRGRQHRSGCRGGSPPPGCRPTRAGSLVLLLLLLHADGHRVGCLHGLS